MRNAVFALLAIFALVACKLSPDQLQRGLDKIDQLEASGEVTPDVAEKMRQAVRGENRWILDLLLGFGETALAVVLAIMGVNKLPAGLGGRGAPKPVDPVGAALLQEFVAERKKAVCPPPA